MKTFDKAAALLASLLTLAACAPLSAGTAASSAAGEDRAAILAAGDAWNAAYAARNPEALAALYATDAIVMPDTAATARGSADIGKFFGIYMGLLTEGGFTPVVTSSGEIEVAGNLGIRSGTYSVKDKSGAIVDTGKWLENWRKTNGKWQIIRNIWNSDQLPLLPPWAFTAAPGTSGVGEEIQ